MTLRGRGTTETALSKPHKIISANPDSYRDDSYRDDDNFLLPINLSSQKNNKNANHSF